MERTIPMSKYVTVLMSLVTLGLILLVDWMTRNDLGESYPPIMPALLAGFVFLGVKLAHLCEDDALLLDRILWCILAFLWSWSSILMSGGEAPLSVGIAQTLLIYFGALAWKVYEWAKSPE